MSQAAQERIHTDAHMGDLEDVDYGAGIEPAEEGILRPEPHPSDEKKPASILTVANGGLPPTPKVSDGEEEELPDAPPPSLPPPPPPPPPTPAKKATPPVKKALIAEDSQDAPVSVSLPAILNAAASPAKKAPKAVEEPAPTTTLKEIATQEDAKAKKTKEQEKKDKKQKKKEDKKKKKEEKKKKKEDKKKKKKEAAAAKKKAKAKKSSDDDDDSSSSSSSSSESGSASQSSSDVSEDEEEKPTVEEAPAKKRKVPPVATPKKEEEKQSGSEEEEEEDEDEEEPDEDEDEEQAAARVAAKAAKPKAARRTKKEREKIKREQLARERAEYKDECPINPKTEKPFASYAWYKAKAIKSSDKYVLSADDKAHPVWYIKPKKRIEGTGSALKTELAKVRETPLEYEGWIKCQENKMLVPVFLDKDSVPKKLTLPIKKAIFARRVITFTEWDRVPWMRFPRPNKEGDTVWTPVTTDDLFESKASSARKKADVSNVAAATASDDEPPKKKKDDEDDMGHVTLPPKKPKKAPVAAADEEEEAAPKPKKKAEVETPKKPKKHEAPAAAPAAQPAAKKAKNKEEEDEETAPPPTPPTPVKKVGKKVVIDEPPHAPPPPQEPEAPAKPKNAKTKVEGAGLKKKEDLTKTNARTAAGNSKGDTVPTPVVAAKPVSTSIRYAVEAGASADDIFNALVPSFDYPLHTLVGIIVDQQRKQPAGFSQVRELSERISLPPIGSAETKFDKWFPANVGKICPFLVRVLFETMNVKQLTREKPLPSAPLPPWIQIKRTDFVTDMFSNGFRNMCERVWNTGKVNPKDGKPHALVYNPEAFLSDPTKDRAAVLHAIAELQKDQFKGKQDTAIVKGELHQIILALILALYEIDWAAAVVFYDAEEGKSMMDED